MPRRVTLDSTDANDNGAGMDNGSSHQTKRRNNATPKTPTPVQSPPYTPLTDWEREYKVLRQAYRKQECRLQKLEHENKMLKQQVQNKNSTSVAIETEDTPRTSLTCSPGTKFVSELVEVMELDVGQHEILANIMDRHYDNTKQRRCSM